jgi:hypothetical protein
MKSIILKTSLFILFSFIQSIAFAGDGMLPLKPTKGNEIKLKLNSRNINSSLVIEATQKEIPGGIFAPKRGKPIKGHGN